MLKQILILKNNQTGELVERESMDHTMVNRKRLYSLEKRIVTTLFQITEFDGKGNKVKQWRRTPDSASIDHLPPVKPLKFDPVRNSAHKRIEQQIRDFEAKKPKKSKTPRKSSVSDLLDLF